jgi:hypothetical protein
MPASYYFHFHSFLQFGVQQSACLLSQQGTAPDVRVQLIAELDWLHFIQAALLKSRIDYLLRKRRID